jgi:hypothetical protein
MALYIKLGGVFCHALKSKHRLSCSVIVGGVTNGRETGSRGRLRRHEDLDRHSTRDNISHSEIK